MYIIEIQASIAPEPSYYIILVMLQELPFSMKTDSDIKFTKLETPPDRTLTRS